MRARFFFVEPSKVGSQHITLIEGYLSALLMSAVLGNSFDLVFGASRSTVAALSAGVRARIKHEPILVMNAEKRRLILKTLVEIYAVTRYLVKMRRGDVVFVSCVLPTTLLFLELINKVLRRPGFFVSLHGEVEGLFDKSLQRPQSFGFWVLQWLRLRRSGSTLALVVIDDFIKSKLVREFPDKLAESDIFVAYHPVTPFPLAASVDAVAPSACFVGYRTAFKGFDQFMQLSKRLPGVAFRAIGGGKVENVQSGQTTAINGNQGYLCEIAQCSVALFPYVAGYTCSLSAAALDALSAGVHIIASDRPCFVSLAEYFGSDVVTICRSPDEVSGLLGDPIWLEKQRTGKALRLHRLAGSKYSLEGVRACFERFIEGFPVSGKTT
jgi:glycosyltransferase involved in cell wall biosynthesis